MPTLHIDMDGVVADWEAAARTFIKSHVDINGNWPDQDWQKIRSQDHFYRNLPKMPQADAMMDLAMRFRDSLGWKLVMLTAIPHKNDMHEVFYDKMLWMQDYYPGIPVHFGPYSKDKAHHCSPGDILVDDRISNITEWVNAGGVAVHVTRNYELALEELREIFDFHLRDRRSSQNPDLS